MSLHEDQVRPPSTVRRIVLLVPDTQATSADTGAKPRKRAVLPVARIFQVRSGSLALFGVDKSPATVFAKAVTPRSNFRAMMMLRLT